MPSVVVFFSIWLAAVHALASDVPRDPFSNFFEASLGDLQEELGSANWQRGRIGSRVSVRYRGQTYAGEVIAQSLSGDPAKIKPLTLEVLFSPNKPQPAGLAVSVELP